jgi:P-type E1-E2 ATPase
MISIPNYKTIDIQHIVCDYNGTIAKDGILLPQVIESLQRLSQHYRIHVITADTFGSVASQLAGENIEIKILLSDNHTEEKSNYIKELGAEHCVALGNGNNDSDMLQQASIGIAILGDEGCSTQTLLHSDLLCKDIKDALDLLIYPKRLIATLRK